MIEIVDPMVARGLVSEVEALRLKPERHHFATDEQVQVVRFMSMSGG